MTIVAFVPDLMDRSRIRAAVPDVRFGRTPADAAGADVVMVDLARHAGDLAMIRAATRGRVVAFGPHVDDILLADATTAGADLVLARSRFFRDPAAALAAISSTGPDSPGATPEGPPSAE